MPRHVHAGVLFVLATWAAMILGNTLARILVLHHSGHAWADGLRFVTG